MNKLGISSACFYPLETEKSLEKICNGGYDACELFINLPSELSDKFIKKLIDMKNSAGVEILSLHPFSSFAESFFIFSSYERRFHDILPFYERYFEVMQMLDARIFVVHGAKIPGSVCNEICFERFARLSQIGKKYNVTVCQENVVDHRSQSPEYILSMAKYVGDDFGMVLDIKQARRTHLSPYDFVSSCGKYIKHMHISDYNANNNCIPPLEGKFDFSELFSEMQGLSYSGAYIIELYENSYSDEAQIKKSYDKITDLLIDN